MDKRMKEDIIYGNSYYIEKILVLFIKSKNNFTIAFSALMFLNLIAIWPILSFTNELNFVEKTLPTSQPSSSNWKPNPEIFLTPFVKDAERLYDKERTLMVLCKHLEYYFCYILLTLMHNQCWQKLTNIMVKIYVDNVLIQERCPEE